MMLAHILLHIGCTAVQPKLLNCLNSNQKILNNLLPALQAVGISGEDHSM